MIHRVVDLQTEDVAAIMTPRPEMVTISADTPIEDAFPMMIENGFSRVPVIRDGIDDIVGILYARDLLSHCRSTATDGNSAATATVASIAKDVLYAPESQGIGDLLEAMRLQKVHMAIIVDEYSGVSGLVTLEDILEEIVGDISDEYDDHDDALWIRHTDGRTEVDARYHLDDLNEQYDFGFPEDEEFDTIGGFVTSCFGRIPANGEEHFWGRLKLTVLEADERRIIKVRIDGEVEPKSVTQNAG
ncbi:MAG: hemolysin family protein [Planctomycetaceae bacterium]